MAKQKKLEPQDISTENEIFTMDQVKEAFQIVRSCTCVSTMTKAMAAGFERYRQEGFAAGKAEADAEKFAEGMCEAAKIVRESAEGYRGAARDVYDQAAGAIHNAIFQLPTKGQTPPADPFTSRTQFECKHRDRYRKPDGTCSDCGKMVARTAPVAESRVAKLGTMKARATMMRKLYWLLWRLWHAPTYILPMAFEGWRGGYGFWRSVDLRWMGLARWAEIKGDDDE